VAVSRGTIVSDHRNDVQIGLFALIAVLLLAMMILVFGGFKDFLANTYPVTASFSDAVGTAEGTPVRLLGIDIGRVRRISLSPDHKGVVMRLDIKSDVDVPVNAPLAIKLEGFIANIYLEFGVGDATTYLPKNGAAKVQGEVHTFAAYVEKATIAVTDMTKNLGGSVGGLGKGLQNLVDSLNDVAGDPAFRQNVKDIAANGSAVSADLKQRLPDLIAHFDTALTTAQKSLEQSSRLIDTYQGLGDDLRKTNSQVQDQIAHQGANLDKLQASLVDTANNISALAKSLNEIATAVNNGEGSLGKLVRQDDLYRSVVKTVDMLSGAAKEFEELANVLKKHPDWIIKGPPKERQ
jgi:phospholipid/cholesterol/gamma-HCH transport system substrate-binding protein